LQRGGERNPDEIVVRISESLVHGQPKARSRIPPTLRLIATDLFSMGYKNVAKQPFSNSGVSTYERVVSGCYIDFSGFPASQLVCAHK
jgi:hypothetical protein